MSALCAGAIAPIAGVTEARDRRGVYGLSCDRNALQCDLVVISVVVVVVAVVAVVPVAVVAARGTLSEAGCEIMLFDIPVILPNTMQCRAMSSMCYDFPATLLQYQFCRSFVGRFPPSQQHVALYSLSAGRCPAYGCQWPRSRAEQSRSHLVWPR